VFDVVNAITIQGLETRPTDSFALVVLSILALLLFSSDYPAVFRPTGLQKWRSQ